MYIARQLIFECEALSHESFIYAAVGAFERLGLLVSKGYYTERFSYDQRLLVNISKQSIVSIFNPLRLRRVRNRFDEFVDLLIRERLER